MLEPERLQTILRIVRERGVVAVRALSDATGASAATLRRDLAKLAEMGAVNRVHGGVEYAGPSDRPQLATRAFDVSQTLNIDKKRAIARVAAGLCQDGDSIIINAGTTTFEMVDFLAHRRLQILTNSFPIAEALIKTSQNRILMPGGEIYREQGIVLSPFDDDSLQHTAAARMFMSAYSVGPLGIIEGDPLIARAEAKLLSRAAELVVLVDSSKFEPRGNFAVAPLSRVKTLITDDRAPAAMLDMLRQAGVDVILVPVGSEATERGLSSAA